MALRKDATDRQIEIQVNELARKANNSGTVKLRAGFPTTVVSDPRIYAVSRVWIQGTSASGAVEMATGLCRVSSISNGSFTIAHRENTDTTRDFIWMVV